MTAFISALVSYLGVDFLMAVLARLGIVGSRATVITQATKRLAPVAVRVIARLKERRNQLDADSSERQELDEEIEALSDAQKSLAGGWFR